MSRKEIRMWKKLQVMTLTAFMVVLALLIPEAEVYAEAEANTVTIEEWYELGEIETSAPNISFFSLDDGNVQLNDGNFDDWISQINLTDADSVRTFYDNLVEGSDNDGENDFLIEDSYFNWDHKTEVAVVKGTITVNSTDETVIGNTVSEKMNEIFYNYEPYIVAAYSAFDRDHPEVFWLKGSYWGICDGTYSYLPEGTSSSVSYTVTVNFVLQGTDSKGNSFDIRAEGYQSQSAIEAAIEKRDGYVDDIFEEVKEKNTYEKIQHFNNVLTKRNEYNTSSNLNNIGHDCRECISALEGRIRTDGPVCEAYARAFKVLCDKAAIPCVLVDGTANNGSVSEAHMWNYVKVRENWYAVDVTWNDPMVQGVTGDADSGYESEVWLLVGSDTEINSGVETDRVTFIASHPVTNQAFPNGTAFTNGPVLSAGEYVHTSEQVTSISDMIVTLSPSAFTYDGTAKTPKVEISGLNEGTDFDVAYANNTNAGTATVTISGKEKYTGTLQKTFTIAVDISDMTATLSPDTFTYDGAAKMPEVTIEGLKEGTDFEVEYSDNTNAGTAKVTITGKGNYAGTITAEFTITEAKPEAGGSTGTDEDYQQPEGGNSNGTNGTAQQSGSNNITAPSTPEATTAATAVASGVTATVKTNTDKTASVTAIDKTGKKTIIIAATATVKGVSYEVTTIGKNAFKKCVKTTKIILPETVKKVEKNAFTGAKKLKIIKFTSKKVPKIAKGAFSKLNTKKMTVQVSKKMSKKDFNKFKKALKKAGFKGKIKR